MQEVIEAGKLIILSKAWPPGEHPRGLVSAGRTPGGFRIATVRVNQKTYKLVQCNPAKVTTDSEGNTATSKVMVKEEGQAEWLGQVRRYLRPGLESWHLHFFQSGPTTRQA